MDSLNSRVYILNGQPFIIHHNDDVNSVNNISRDILQNTLREVDSSPSGSVHSQVDPDQFIHSVQNVEQNNCVNELVTFEQENGDESSTIHLTVEQAVELGIEFNVCGVNLPTGTFPTNEKPLDTNKDQFIYSKDPSENICLFSAGGTNNLGDETFDNTEQQTLPSTSDASKLKLEPNIIEQLNDSVNPQLTLVPQLHNGTITYTLQVDSNTESVQNHRITNQLSGNGLARSKDPVHMIPIVTSVSDTNFDMSSLNTSTALSTLVQSSLEMTPTSLSLADNNQDRDNGVNFITTTVNSSASNLTHILPNTALLNTESETVGMTKKLIHDNLAVYQHDTLPQIMDSEIALSPPGSNRFVKLNSNAKTANQLNASGKNSASVFMSVPDCESIPASLATPISSSQTIPPKNSTSTSEAYQVNVSVGDRRKIRTLITPDGVENDTKSATRPSILNGVPKEISKFVARFQTADLAKRVGTNKNPIQLVQQGKTFTSVQSLSHHQLKHVAAVLQKNNFDIEQTPYDKNVIFDKKTNTKIIYRIIYPEDLDLIEASDPGDAANRGKKRGRPQKSKPGEQTEPPATEEPPRKKVPLPRTRSGRLSRPPRHIVRDYKRIRRLDTDDMEQDGAYSDYQTDDQDEQSSKSIENQLLPGLAETKKRRISSSFRCPKCNKVYLGILRMEDHFFKYPDHRPEPDLKQLENSSATDPESNSVVAGVEKPGGDGGGAMKATRGTFSKKKSKRRPGSSVKPDKMRAQLKQLLDLCSESELVEVVGPVVASVLSAWELLLLKVESISDSGRSRMRVDALCAEIKTLLAKFTEVSAALFQPIDTTCLLDAPTFEMKDMSVSSVMGVPCGVYRVDESLLKSDKILLNRTVRSDDAVTPSNTNSAPVTKVEAVVDSVADASAVQDGELVDQAPKATSSVQFLLSGDEMMCTDDRTGLDSVDRFVNERLQNFTSTGRDLKSDVDELVFNALERGGVVRRTDLDAPDLSQLADPFLAMGSRRPSHVSASTEDLIKSLENFGADDDLPSDDRPNDFTSPDNFNRVNMTAVDTLDFEVLSQNFHSTGTNSQ